MEPKRCGRSLVAVILGKTVAQAAQSGMIVPSLLEEPLPSQLRAEAETSETPGESLFVSDDENAMSFWSQVEPETQTDGGMTRQVVHWLEDNDSGHLPLSPTGYPDEDLTTAPDGAGMLTVPNDQTATHEVQSGAPSMPADSPDVVSSQGRGTAAGSRERRIGPFVCSPSPSPPPPRLVPTQGQSVTEPSSGPPEPAGSAQILGSGTAAPPASSSLSASTISGSLAPARPDIQEVASAGTQQSERCVFHIFPKAPAREPMTFEQYLEALDSVCDGIMRLTLSPSDAADTTGPMTVAAPLAGSVPQSDYREPTGVSAPALAATTASALQTPSLGSAMQVPGPAAAFPSDGLSGAAPVTEIQSVGNLFESGGPSEHYSTVCEIDQVFDRPTTDAPMPDVPGQFSTPAGPFGEQMGNVSAFSNTVQHLEPAVPNYPNPNGEQTEEYSAAQALITRVDSAVVTQSTYPQEPAWTSMQANDVDLGMEESPMAPSSMPSNGWVGALLPRPETGFFDRPAAQDAPTVVEESGPVRGPISEDTTSIMEASPAVPAEVINPPLPSTSLEQPPISMPPSELEEVRPVADSAPVEPTSGQTDSISLSEQSEARPSELVPSAPEPAATREGPMAQSTQVAAPIGTVTPPAATTDEIPAIKRGSWCTFYLF